MRGGYGSCGADRKKSKRSMRGGYSYNGNMGYMKGKILSPK